MKDLVFTQNGQVLTDSLTVAETFGKDHKDVLRAINSIDCEASFKQRNFAPLEGTYINGIGVECKRPVFNLTKDGFVLLVMGFTGKKAMAFKIKYIEAFNAMERALAAPVPALDAKAIGGIVKKCAAKAVKDEIANVRPAPFKVATAYEQFAFEDTIKRLVRETLIDFFAPEDNAPHPSGMAFGNWAASAVHAVGAMRSEYAALNERVKQAKALLAAK